MPSSRSPREELRASPAAEGGELTGIYVKRGVEADLARRVFRQLMAKDALGAHARDELGISQIMITRPVQAALTSAATFAAGAIVPLAAVILSPFHAVVVAVSVCSLVYLAVLGAIGAKTGGANVFRATARVTFWGTLAMALTAGIGLVFRTSV